MTNYCCFLLLLVIYYFTFCVKLERDRIRNMWLQCLNQIVLSGKSCVHVFQTVLRTFLYTIFFFLFIFYFMCTQMRVYLMVDILVHIYCIMWVGYYASKSGICIVCVPNMKFINCCAPSNCCRQKVYSFYGGCKLTKHQQNQKKKGEEVLQNYVDGNFPNSCT